MSVAASDDKEINYSQKNNKYTLILLSQIVKHLVSSQFIQKQ